MRTHEVAGVTVTTMKLEQSLAREVMSGTLPERVPVTALAQLLALQVGLLYVRERAPWPMASAKMKEKIFMVEGNERLLM
jgi:hypothetical protein